MFVCFSAGGHWEQFWHGQECPLLDAVHPVSPLPTTALPTLQGALKDGFGEAVTGVRHARTMQVSVSGQLPEEAPEDPQGYSSIALTRALPNMNFPVSEGMVQIVQLDPSHIGLSSSCTARDGEAAQTLERRTGMPLSQVRFPGATRSFSPRANFQCRLSCGVRTALVCNRVH